LDSDVETRAFVEEIPSRNIALDDAVYVKEILGEMKPNERLAFALRHSYDASIKEIGTLTGYSETTVKTLLKSKNKQFRNAA
jgi:DNA-directed RNA polymerase specialized sigma24 family protein